MIPIQYSIDTFSISNLNNLSIDLLNTLLIYSVTYSDGTDDLLNENTYDNLPIVTGVSPIMINQDNNFAPSGYEMGGVITESLGEYQLRKDFYIDPQNMVDSTQKYENRFK